jgi:ABC-type Fe2+-enterobactin transport system substrate-binding protein
MKKKVVRFVGSFLLGLTLSAPIIASAATTPAVNNCLRLCLRLGFRPILCARLCL